jgi:hypothetical protein
LTEAVAVRKSLVLALLFACHPLAARAEHATITLSVFRSNPETGLSEEVASAGSDQEPPAGGNQQRQVLKVKAHEPLALQFIFTNAYPHGVTKDVTIRFFVVREDKAGQKYLPDLKGDVVVQGQFQLNFKPKARVGARVAFKVPRRGNYLLRVDSLNTQSDHEHFSALDLHAE